MSAIAGVPISLAGAAASAVGGLSSWFLPMLVAAVAYFHYELLDPESRPIDVVDEMMFDNYDFVIVGAGSAGKFFCFFLYLSDKRSATRR